MKFNEDLLVIGIIRQACRDYYYEHEKFIKTEIEYQKAQKAYDKEKKSTHSHKNKEKKLAARVQSLSIKYQRRKSSLKEIESFFLGESFRGNPSSYQWITGIDGKYFIEMILKGDFDPKRQLFDDKDAR